MRRLTHEDDGAMVVMVAVMLVMLLSVGAIAIDVGLLFSERRELQNGADAAVLAVAENCASGEDEVACDTGPQGDRYRTAQQFANENATDGTAAVAPDTTGVVVDYPAGRAVVRATSLNSGEGFVRHNFASIFGNESTEVSAESTAIWGPIAFGSVPTLPLTFSQCEYDLFLADGAGFAEEPWTVANNGGLQTIWTQGGNNHQPVPECAGGPAGQDLPGGFGWLDGQTKGGLDKGSCVASIEGDTGNADPGASSPCSANWLKENVLNKTVLLPVYNQASADGKAYTFASYAAFHVTGYSFPGAREGTAVAGCKNPKPDCLQGWFTTDAALGGIVDPDAPDTGVRAVQLVQN